MTTRPPRFTAQWDESPLAVSDDHKDIKTFTYKLELTQSEKHKHTVTHEHLGISWETCRNKHVDSNLKEPFDPVAHLPCNTHTHTHAHICQPTIHHSLCWTILPIFLLAHCTWEELSHHTGSMLCSVRDTRHYATVWSVFIHHSSYTDCCWC